MAEILAKIHRAYTELDSYSDRGYVLSKRHPDEPFEKDLSFTTHFKKPNLFRFEWYDHNKLSPETANIVWSDGIGAYSKCSFEDGKKECESIGMAIAGATGVSSGTAPTIACMLLKGIWGRPLYRSSHMTIQVEKEVNGKLCHVLLESDKNREYYFEIESGILVHMYEDRVIEPGSSEKHLRELRFKSFTWFFRWLKELTEKLTEKDKPLRFIHSRFYEEVNLNPELSDEIFSQAGPAQILT